MSVNKYNPQSKTLTTLATGDRTWVGTSAAYQAQKQAGTLPNDVIICITDDEVDTSHYSTDETFTGMYWIDGKKIYRKVFDLQSNVNHNTTLSIPNIEYSINYYGIFVAPWDSKYHPFPYYHLGTEVFDLNVIDTNGVRLFAIWSGSSSYVGAGTKIVVEYTKTTD